MQSPPTSFESVYFGDIYAAASTCKGVENQVADIMAFLITELGCAVIPEDSTLVPSNSIPSQTKPVRQLLQPRGVVSESCELESCNERRRSESPVQEPLPFFISMIVNATTPYTLDIGAVIDAAHVLVMRLYENDPSVGAAWSGHQLFLSAFVVAAQGQPSPHPEILNACVFWTILSKFTLEEFIEIQVRLFDKLEGRLCVFAEVTENVKQLPPKGSRGKWRQESEEMRLAKRQGSLGGQMSAFLRRRRSTW